MSTNIVKFNIYHCFLFFFGAAAPTIIHVAPPTRLHVRPCRSLCPITLALLKSNTGVDLC